MSIEDLLRKGRHKNSPDLDLTVLNAKVLQGLKEEEGQGRVSTLVISLLYAVVESPLLAFSTGALVLLVPLQGIVRTLGLAEPVYGYILGLLIP